MATTQDDGSVTVEGLMDRYSLFVHVTDVGENFMGPLPKEGIRQQIHWPKEIVQESLRTLEEKRTTEVMEFVVDYVAPISDSVKGLQEKGNRVFGFASGLVKLLGSSNIGGVGLVDLRNGTITDGWIRDISSLGSYSNGEPSSDQIGTHKKRFLNVAAEGGYDLALAVVGYLPK